MARAAAWADAQRAVGAREPVGVWRVWVMHAGWPRQGEACWLNSAGNSRLKTGSPWIADTGRIVAEAVAVAAGRTHRRRSLIERSTEDRAKQHAEMRHRVRKRPVFRKRSLRRRCSVLSSAGAKTAGAQCDLGGGGGEIAHRNTKREREREIREGGVTLRMYSQQIPTPANPLLNIVPRRAANLFQQVPVVSSPTARGLGGPGMRCGVGGPRVLECLPGHSRHRCPLPTCCLRPLARVSNASRMCGAGAGVRRAVKGRAVGRRYGRYGRSAPTRAPLYTCRLYVPTERPYLAEAGLVAAAGP
jgi:hypothetical protein